LTLFPEGDSLADIHIERQHKLGLAGARKIAYSWAEQAEQDLQMDCTYEEGTSRDEVCFSRAGVSGTLEVTQDRFELNARLGFLLGAFKTRIESEIVKNLDAMLAAKPVQPAAQASGSGGKGPARKKAL
jgi:putative polyhydroxyalkanoate system protein